MATTQTDRIRKLNDVFRTTWLTGRVLMTSGIRSLPDTIQSGIAEAVQRFDTFMPITIRTGSMTSFKGLSKSFFLRIRTCPSNQEQPETYVQDPVLLQQGRKYCHFVRCGNEHPSAAHRLKTCLL